MDALAKSLPFLCASSLIVVLGAVFGQNYIVLRDHRLAHVTDLAASFTAWDGEHYVRIATEGYSFDPNEQSNVAFFPAYPLIGRWIATITGWRMDVSLLTVSYAFLLAAFVAAVLYFEPVEAASPASALQDAEREIGDGGITKFVLLALAFFPTTFYFRLAYTESLFLFTVILTLYGMKRRWPFWALAAVIGLATATRAAGVALLVPLAWCLWERAPIWTSFVVKSMLIVPVACWGLAAYMLFLYLSFGDPLVFAQTQQHWDRRPPIPIVKQLLLELRLEPVVCVYDPACRCHQIHGHADPSPLLSMYYANPIYLLLFAGLMAWGALKGWLSREEILAGATILLFSYLSKGYTTCMCSQARYAASAFPVYIVMGRLLQRLPEWVVPMIVGVSGFIMGAYSALFVRWYDFY